MKNIKFILFAILSLALITSCDRDFEEINTDPNRPLVLPPHLLLGTTQRVYTNIIYSVGIGGDMGECWGQHWAKVQYNDEARYVPRRSSIDAIWSNIYSAVISEASAMSKLAEDEGNTNIQAAGLVMQAIGYQTLTDLFGPIPYSEAINPEIVKPKFDDQSAVYEGIIAKLTTAAAMFSADGGEITASSDLFYGGDINKWKKLANSLKFRALMRISSTRDVSSELQALINGGNMFMSNADNAELTYLSAAPDANPIWETIIDGSRPEYKINSVLVDMLNNLSDPRLEVYAAPNDSDLIVGKPSGYGLATTLPNEALGYTYTNISGLGDFYLDPTLPGVTMSYSQLSFLMAEAANEGLISGGLAMAKTYFDQGITASFAWNGLDAATYLANPALNLTSQADAKTKIATQEWIALFGQGFETWTEWRRTGIPALTPAIEGDINQIPSRLYYSTILPSINGENYNSAVQRIGADNLTSPLFWQ